MSQAGRAFFIARIAGKLCLCACIFLQAVKVQAQCGTLKYPDLFGQSVTAIYCKNNQAFIGVNEPDTTQIYYFSQYKNGAEVSRKGGPLTGSGSTLSVSTMVRSAADAGQYRVTTYNSCGQSSYDSFYIFYGSIDNLSISGWGSNGVTFKWAACGPVPAVTYDYIVTKRANPDQVPFDSIFSTTDTFASVPTGLTNGSTYYIHVRVNTAQWPLTDPDPPFVDPYFNDCNSFPWITIRFVACSATASVGSITPVNSVVCAGSTVTLTATSGFTNYQWYDENNNSVTSATSSPTFNASSAGQYKVYVTKSGSTCAGMIATATVLSTSIQTGNFFGTGDFYSGDTVRLGLSNTVIGQTYKILKDGTEVYSVQGIGNPEQPTADDTILIKFVMTSASQAGLYTVRTSSSYCSPVDFGSAQVNFITGVTLCPNSNTSFSFSSTGNNTTFRWQVDQTGNDNFTNISNGGVYAGATTKTLTITGATATMYGYRYRCVCSGGTAVTSTPRTLRFGMTWVGGASGNLTNWNTAANWSCNIAPPSNIDFIIPPTSNQPVITTNITCRSVVLKPGATLKVNNSTGKLTITGTGL